MIGGVVLSLAGRRGADDTLADLEQLIIRQQFDQAEQLAISSHDRFPDRHEFNWLAAFTGYRLGHYEAAYRRIEQIPADVSYRIDVDRLRADMASNHLMRLKDAEEASLAVLAKFPDDLAIHDMLARQYGLTARRFDAIPHILALIRAGEDTDLILLLGRDRGVIGDVEKLKRARKVLPEDPRPLLGLAWHAVNEERHEEADSLLREAVRLGKDLPAVWAARGRWLAERKQIEPWREWIRDCPAGAEVDPGVWLARGEWADHLGDKQAALRCYWECARKAPEIRQAPMRVIQLLGESGRKDEAAQCQVYMEKLLALGDAQDRNFAADASRDVESLLNLIDRYRDVGRYWEALALTKTAMSADPDRADIAPRLAELRRLTKDLPLELTATSANPFASLDLSSLPLPRTDGVAAAPSTEVTNSQPAISFAEQAAQQNLNFRYEDGAQGSRLHMQEITGGGLGVIDYDVDGYPDLFCPQGSTQRPETPSSISDQLFHNQGGQRFGDVSRAAGIIESGFGQGVAAGDLNTDGFPDLFVGNIGPNAIWINQGDGTFEEVATAWGLQGSVWTTSCLIADIDQDGDADLYEVNYLRGDGIFDRVCRGEDGADSQCMPYDFEPEVDRVWLNSGDGHLIDGRSLLSRTPDGKGLGVVAYRPSKQHPLCVYVANDTTPNFLWVPEQQAGNWRLEERGFLAGVALSASGKPQGSMGIAVGDLDHDQRPDLCVSNFLAESYAFYHAQDEMSYRDEAQESGLRDLTVNRLGFGTQLFDADGDGHLELFLANGHIQDLTRTGRPYRMQPQLCRFQKGRFEEVSADTLGSYFQLRWLARAAATWDWNRDGRLDLVVSHLDDDLKLLTNTSPQAPQSLELKLIGRAQSRDGIGAIVTIRTGEQTWTRQLSAGGGYQANNEQIIHWAAGGIQKIDELSIDWMGGSTQTVRDVVIPYQGIAVEGRDGLLAQSSAK